MVMEITPEPTGAADKIGRLLRAGVLTGLSDGAFATVLFVLFYHSTFTRLWQGVAGVPLGASAGASAVESGTEYAFLGILFHFLVAFTWSAVFLFLVMRSQRVLSALRSTAGQLKVAAIYGPFIWLVMSLLVIPLFLHRPPAINSRWWIQLIGHFPFVGVPMVMSLARRPRRSAA
jgi:hypothetical protein